jgi:hypothetical protein
MNHHLTEYALRKCEGVHLVARNLINGLFDNSIQNRLIFFYVNNYA